jgi:hypothetical protein
MLTKKITFFPLLLAFIASNHIITMEQKLTKTRESSTKHYYDANGKEIFFVDGIININNPGTHVYPDWKDYPLSPDNYIAYHTRFNDVIYFNLRDYQMAGKSHLFLEEYQAKMLKELAKNKELMIQRHEEELANKK